MIDKDLLKKLRLETNAGYTDCRQALENTKSYEEAIQWLRSHGAAKAVKKMDADATDGVISLKMDAGRAVILEVNSQTDFVAKNELFTNFVNRLTDLVFNSNAQSVDEVNALKYDEHETVAQKIVNLISVIGEKISLKRVKVACAPCVGGYLHANKRIGVIVLAESGTPDVLKKVGMHVAALSPAFVSENDVDPKWREQELNVIREQVKNEPKPGKFMDKIIEGRYQKVLKENVLLEQEFVLDPKLKVSDFLKANNAKVTGIIRFEIGV